MPTSCPRCSRLNPSQALFCYFDGVALGNQAQFTSDPARQRFPMPFVFSSGQRCQSFDELALGIQNHWEETRELIRDGSLVTFLTGLGRADLARKAREAAREADIDQGVNQLLQALPVSVLEPARLVVEPAQINLGVLRPGQNVRFELHLRNTGMGLITGNISSDGVNWIYLGEPSARSPRKVFQFLHETVIVVHVNGPALRASVKPLLSWLSIESNAGKLQVPITAEVPVTPFPDGVLAGAKTPRQLAEKAQARPREAAELFAVGAVARWYQANGWIYPVQDPAASGVAGVQQYFEALGVTSPPRVTISNTELQLQGRVGEAVEGVLQLHTVDRKPIFAHANSDQPWLQISSVDLNGRSATVQLRVPQVPNVPGQTLSACVTVTSNGRQRFRVPVHLRVAAESWTHVPAATVAAVAPDTNARLPDYQVPPPVRRAEILPEVLPVQAADSIPEVLPIEAVPTRPVLPPPTSGDPAVEPERFPLGRYLLASIPVLLLVMGLLTTLIRDLGLRPDSPSNSEGLTSTSPAKQLLALLFHDKEEAVRLTRGGGGVKPADEGEVSETFPGFWEPSMRFGLSVRDPERGTITRRLTFEPDGKTNNTVVHLNGEEWLFGERPFRTLDREYLGDWPGRWLERSTAPIGKLAGRLQHGRRSVWVYDAEKIHVAQTVGLVLGAQSGHLDTCLIHYQITNHDREPHTVGLRFLLDTFIGNNDGVPFLLPGKSELCTTLAEFNGSENIPDFIQACESESRDSRGTVAQIVLRLPGLEPPSRVTLSAWPNPRLPDPRARQEKTLWTVPLFPIKTLPPGDSAVTIYWNPQVLPPGSSREMAFTYGLGTIASSEGGGQLALSAAGAFEPGGEFTLTAEVRDPVKGQTVTLELPEGFSLVSGQMTQSVPPLARSASTSFSPVTWRIRCGPREGTYKLRVRSSTGASQSRLIQVKIRGIFGN